MKIVVWIGRFLRGGFAPGARRNVKALAPFVDKIIVAPLYVLPENHSLYPYVEDFDEEVQDIFKVVNHLPVTDPTADGYYSVCEYDRIPERWVEILNSAKVIMTESHFCKRIFSQQINNAEKIHVIPYILSSDFIHYDPNGHIFRPQNTKKDDFLFGSVFEWVPRKVPERTIKAFLKEFDPSEKVKLVFRTELPESKEMLKKLLGNHYNEFKTAVKQKRIIIIQKRIKKIVDF